MNIEILVLPAAIVSVAGAIMDIRKRSLPNWLSAVLAITAGGGLALAAGADALASSALHSLLALLVGMLVFKLGMVGGGDAKFYAAAALGLPIGQALPFLGWTSLAGLLLLLVMVVGRRVVRSAEGANWSWSVPYGVAISAGFIATLFVS